MAEPDLDLAFLSRQVLGDRDLERELLLLFRQQCERLGPVLVGTGADAARAEAAHTLRGAAAALGALRVAGAAGRVETALAGEGAEAARAEIGEALDSTLGAIADRLAAA